MNVILSPSRLERIEMLRQNMLVEPQVCVEKALYTTESFRSTEGAPIEYRRARALDHVLTHLTVGIGPGELFVGRPTGKVRGGPLSPEVNSTWYTKEMDTFHTREQENYAEVPEADKQIIRDCCAYWHGKSLFDHWQAAVPDDMKFANGPIIGGGLSEYVVVPATQIVKIGDNVPFEHAAVSEPLGCCIHSIEKTRILRPHFNGLWQNAGEGRAGPV